MPPKRVEVQGLYEVPRHDEPAGKRIRAALARLAPLENEPIFNARGLHIGEKPARAITLSIPRLHLLEGRVTIWRGSEVPSRTAFNTFRLRGCKPGYANVVAVAKTPTDSAIDVTSPATVLQYEVEDNTLSKDSHGTSHNEILPLLISHIATGTKDRSQSLVATEIKILEKIPDIYSSAPAESASQHKPDDLVQHRAEPPTIQPSPDSHSASFIRDRPTTVRATPSLRGKIDRTLSQLPSTSGTGSPIQSEVQLESLASVPPQEQTLRTPSLAHQFSVVSAKSGSSSRMAPVQPPELVAGKVGGTIKNVIQTLYEVQSQVHGYQPETQGLLVDKVTELAHQLSHLKALTDPARTPDDDIHKALIAREIIDYVDDARNPDIYTRDFVELVQRGNAVINGKQQAFSSFSQILADEIKKGVTGVDGHVDRIMKNAGLEDVSVTNGMGMENGKE